MSLSAPPGAQLDHLIVAAATLEEGVAWCEKTLGLAPGPGGEHALFGTHNRLLKLANAAAPNAYLEIIATHPQVKPTRQPPLGRWFDLDDAALQARLAKQGPQLMHWVVSVPRLDQALGAWQALGIHRGEPITASRPTPSGLLQWQIAVRDDGQRLFDGCLPTLIQWGDTHPALSMPESGLKLSSLRITHPDAETLNAAFTTLDLHSFQASPGPAALTATLATPLGEVVLTSST